MDSRLLYFYTLLVSVIPNVGLLVLDTTSIWISLLVWPSWLAYHFFAYAFFSFFFELVLNGTLLGFLCSFYGWVLEASSFSCIFIVFFLFISCIGTLLGYRLSYHFRFSHRPIWRVHTEWAAMSISLEFQFSKKSKPLAPLLIYTSLSLLYSLWG